MIENEGVSPAQEDGREFELERIERVYAGYRGDPRKRLAWSADNPGNLRMREEVVGALLDLAPELFGGDQQLLDAGCGAGWWLARLQRDGVAPARLLGVELLADRVSAARERVPGARVLQGDIRHLPLPNASCSLVMLFTVLSAMGTRDDVVRALGEARRVLVAGGVIAIWEPRIPTVNRHTRLIGISELRASLGGKLTIRSVTLAPPIARRVRDEMYERLVGIPALRTHRLVIARP